jgi:ATP-dependent Clp protease protease subunit
MQEVTRPAEEKIGYFTLSGDVNSDMVQRVFTSTADMSESGITTAHVLLQSHGGFISDGICLYNLLKNLPQRFVMYNAGAVASIAVIVFLAGQQRHASHTARFMVHKSHASPASGSGPEALKIIAEGLMADAGADLHLTASAALKAGLIESIKDFAPPAATRLLNI